MEYFILQVHQKKCLPASHCNFDLKKNIDDNDINLESGGWQVKAQSCGLSLKEDKFYGKQSCDLYQTTLLTRHSTTNSTRNETRIVMTLSYNFFGDDDSYQCPENLVFQSRDLVMNNASIQGSGQFILQSSFETDLTDPCQWDCYQDTEGACPTKPQSKLPSDVVIISLPPTTEKYDAVTPSSSRSIAGIPTGAPRTGKPTRVPRTGKPTRVPPSLALDMPMISLPPTTPKNEAVMRMTYSPTTPSLTSSTTKQPSSVKSIETKTPNAMMTTQNPGSPLKPSSGKKSKDYKKGNGR